MGAGSSNDKGKGAFPKGEIGNPAPVSVANVNNSPVKVITDLSKNGNGPHMEQVDDNAVKQSVRTNYPHDQSSENKTTSIKINKSAVAERLEWEGDSDSLEEAMAGILGKASKTNLPNYNPNLHHSQQEFAKNVYNTQKSQEHYPETYAQRHNRENYTIGQDFLIREKTIFRSPTEWAESDDDDGNEANTKFDLTRFRAANPGKSRREKDMFSPNDDFETPRYLKESIARNESPRVTTTKLPETKTLPAYSKEEEDLMAELMGDEFVAHQTLTVANMKFTQ